MNVPKEIADKAKVYQEAMEAANKAHEEVVKWLEENTDTNGVYINGLFVTDTPTGNEQGEGEYCEQHTGYCEDDYYGKYYHPIEGSSLFLGYHYEC